MEPSIAVRFVWFVVGEHASKTLALGNVFQRFEPLNFLKHAKDRSPNNKLNLINAAQCI